MLQRAMVCVALVLVTWSSAIAGGPPWISVEMPGDPTNPASRGAVMLVHVYSCGSPTNAPVTATAEGVVNGERRTVALALEPAGSGVYALKQQWPSEGAWVLTFTASVGGTVSTLVALGPNGGVDPVEYHQRPSSVVRAASVQVLARKPSAGDVDALLRATATGETPSLPAATPGSALGYLAGGAGTLALVAGAAVTMAFRRRRR
jgi:hypothetical protein